MFLLAYQISSHIDDTDVHWPFYVYRRYTGKTSKKGMSKGVVGPFFSSTVAVQKLSHFDLLT